MGTEGYRALPLTTDFLYVTQNTVPQEETTGEHVWNTSCPVLPSSRRLIPGLLNQLKLRDTVDESILMVPEDRDPSP